MHLPYFIISLIFLLGTTGLYGSRWLQNKAKWQNEAQIEQQENNVLLEYGVSRNRKIKQISYNDNSSINNILQNEFLKINEKVPMLIKNFNHLSLNAQRNLHGKWIIGYGHLGGVSPKMKISNDDAEKILDNDISVIGKNLKKIILTGMNENEYGALVSYLYSFSISNIKQMQNNPVVILMQENKKQEAALAILNDLSMVNDFSTQQIKQYKKQRTQEYLLFISKIY